MNFLKLSALFIALVSALPAEKEIAEKKYILKEKQTYGDMIFRVFSNEEESSFRFYAENTGFDILDFRFNAELTNMKSSANLPVRRFIRGKQNVLAAQIERISADEKYFYSADFRFFYGIPDPEHAALYMPPVKPGTKYSVDNAFFGSGLHKENFAHAVDISMKTGTPVHAARSGTVIQTREDSDEGGDDERFIDSANFIRILHDDGTYGRYLHLKKNGVHVKPGQRVNTGEKIGLSGNTGYSTGPHLHFDVIAADGKGGFKTIPWKFADASGRPFEPETGMDIAREQ